MVEPVERADAMTSNVRLSGAQTSPRAESDVRVNYGNVSQIIAASNALGSDGRQAQFFSSDGGKSWGQTVLPLTGSDTFHSDPAVDWTSDGTAWAITMGLSSSATVLQSYKSTDGGATWSFEATASGSDTNVDREIMWTDHSPTSPFKDQIYLIWHSGVPAFVARRTAGAGGSWQTPVQISGSEQTGNAIGCDIKTNSAGDVFAFYPDADGSGKLRLAKSTDGGATFKSPRNDGTGFVQIASLFATTRRLSIPSDRADTGRGARVFMSGGAFRTATKDLVYLVWPDLSGQTGCTSGAGPGSNAASTCKTRIWFTRSTDGGANWTAPQMLNNQASLNDQSFSRLVVDETDGSLMVTYSDTVNDATRLSSDSWAQFSLDDGVNWSSPIQITTAATNETTAGANNFSYGDYSGLTGFGGRFFACWTDRRSGGVEEIWGAPLAIPSMRFVFGKSTFSEDEVSPNQSFNPAYFLNVDGFTNESLGFNAPGDLNFQPGNIPAVTASVDASLNSTLTPGQIATIAADLPTVTVNTFGPLPILPDDPTLNEELQSFFYPYTISFPGDPSLSNLFGALNPHEFVFITLNASLTVGQLTLTAKALIEFAKGEDPYFQNLDNTNPKAFPVWLSYDLRFFKATPSQTHQMFSVPNPSDASDCVRYIQGVINNLNTPGAITNGDTFDNALSQGEDTSKLEFLPADSGGNPTFNFAVARVRIFSNSSVAISPVRVFFRLFSVQSTATTFFEVGTGEGAYRWGSDGSAGHKIALMGVGTNQQGNLEWTTIPCFATARVNLPPTNAPMNTQHDDPNARQITTIAAQEVDTFFGCWLDLNQQGQAGPPSLPAQQFLPASPPTAQSQWDGPFSGSLVSVNQIITNAPHQCLIAEIRFDDTPVPPGANGEDSDKLAQRNIAWLDGPNPGQDPSRVMPHPFEVRASSPALDEVDEILIFWGSTPAGSTASFYLPAVHASDVIALADAMYPAHRLRVIDANTIGCPVGAVTLVPIPKGVGAYAGLLAVELPPGIRRGDSYDIVVRQITKATTAPVILKSTKVELAKLAAETFDQPFSWRTTSGTFQVTITVSTKEELLFPEERLLAWLKWKVSVYPKTLRFYPVLHRYLGYIVGRVGGFGGDPGQIPPSPSGNVPGGPPHHPHHRREEIIELTGKVVSLIYDRFGDFAGFRLLTEHGHEHEFHGREPAVEALAKSAWIERSVISVHVEEHRREHPTSIVLRRYH
jgi:hypothetical protein